MVNYKQSSISLHFETQGVNGWTTKAQRTNPAVNDYQTKYWGLTEKDNIFLKPKDDRNKWRAAWRLDTGAKRLKDAKEANGIGAISPRKAKKCKSRR